MSMKIGGTVVWNARRANKEIREIRERLGLTRREFANRCGVAEQTIKAWESGRGGPCLENMITLCKVFNLDIFQTFGPRAAKAAQELRPEGLKTDGQKLLDINEQPLTPRVAPKLKPEYAPKQEEPAHEDLTQEEPETPIIQMIPRDTTLDNFRQAIIDNLIRAAKVSTDPAVKKLADVLALIDEYEGERRCEGNQSTAA